MTSTETEIKELLLEVKKSVDEIKHALGIGKITPFRVVDIKSRAKRKAQEIINKKDVDKHNRL